jgi:chaperonin GroES
VLPLRSTELRDFHIGGEEITMKITPLRDRIVVQRIEAPEKKEGGIIIPDTAKEKPVTAKVVAVGSGRVLDDGKKVPLEVKKGNKILVGKYAGSEINLEDTEYVILREDEVLGIIE